MTTDVDKLLEGISTLVRSEFEDSPKLSATQFQILDSDLNATVVNISVWAFFKLDNPDMWVSNTSRFHTNEELADSLREYTRPIQVVDACDLH